jgi:nickel/cobalt transporter (NicO) family protein
MRRLLAGVAVIGAALAALVAGAAPAGAHPLGNFSVNHFAELVIGREQVAVHFVTDLAEIPTFQIRDQLDTPEKLSAFAATTCEDSAGRSRLTVDGRRLPLAVDDAVASLAPGSADLPVLRVSCRTRAFDAEVSGSTRLTFRNGGVDDRPGWREIVARGEATELVRSTVPSISASAALTAYPEGQLSAPLDVVEAEVTVRPGSGAASGADGRPDGAIAKALPRQLDAATERLTAMIARPLTVPLAASALVVALVLGALHAFAPGHGKTVIAAYLVAERGSVRQAALIGACVTVTHTAGVLLLGVVLTTWSAFAPASLYPLLGVTSGLLLAGIGLMLVRRALSRRRHARNEHSHDHSHDPGHEGHHHHDDELHQHGGVWHRHPEIGPDTTIGWRSLALMGVAGGLVPSPSALVVLLGASALGKAWFGATLVIAYGIGMACTLMAAGLVLTRGRHLVDRWGWGAGRLGSRATLLPVATSSLIIVVGLSLAARAVLTV